MNDVAKQIKEYYDKGVFPESWLKNLLDKGKITQEEYNSIVDKETV